MFNKDADKNQPTELSKLIDNFTKDPSAENYSSLAEFSSDFQKLNEKQMEAVFIAVNTILNKDNKNSYAWLVLGKLVPQQNEALSLTEYQNKQQQFVNLYNKTLSEDIRKQLVGHIKGLGIFFYGKAIENDDKNYFAWESLGYEFSQNKEFYIVLNSLPKIVSEKIIAKLPVVKILEGIPVRLPAVKILEDKPVRGINKHLCAVFCYGKAIAQKEDLTLAWCNLGIEFSATELSLLGALAILPNEFPENLKTEMSQCKNFSQLREYCFRKSFSSDPANKIALMRLLDLYSGNIDPPQDFFMSTLVQLHNKNNVGFGIVRVCIDNSDRLKNFFTEEIDRYMKSYIEKYSQNSEDLGNFERDLSIVLACAKSLNLKLDVKKDKILNDIMNISDVGSKTNLLTDALDQKTVLGSYFYLKRGSTEPSVKSGTLKTIADELKKLPVKTQFFLPKKKEDKQDKQEEKLFGVKDSTFGPHSTL